MCPSQLRLPLRVGALAGTIMIMMTMASCAETDSGGSADSAGSTSVVTALYPLQFVAERIGGPEVSVVNLAEGGVEPHDLELAPQDTALLVDADLVVYLEGFQPAVDEATASAATGATLDVSDSASLDLTYSPLDEEGGDAVVDPHFWLDPQRLAAVADTVAAELSILSPDQSSTFSANSEQLREQLHELDVDYRVALNDCGSRALVTSHNAFGYLADAYDLQQVGITGLTPETEPSPQALATLTEYVRDNAITTIFYETLVSPDVAETLAEASGATTAVLDPIEGLTDASQGEDYFTIMRSNLENLVKGLSCN